MKQITCPHCGDTYPDFDVAHVCSKGPYAPQLKSKMNERIEKLKESACPKIDWAARYHVELNNGEKEKWMNEWFEKFAELIVAECIDLASAEQKRYASITHRNMSECAVALGNFSLLVKDHFEDEE